MSIAMECCGQRVNVPEQQDDDGPDSAACPDCGAVLATYGKPKRRRWAIFGGFTAQEWADDGKGVLTGSAFKDDDEDDRPRKKGRHRWE